MLDAMEKTISMAQLAKNTEEIARDIETTGTLYRIKRPGRKRLLLVDDHYLERLAATIEFKLMHPNWKEELAESRRQYQAGLCIPLEQALAERGLADLAPNSKSKGSPGRAARGRRKRRR
jgi:hypothetical protein